MPHNVNGRCGWLAAEHDVKAQEMAPVLAPPTRDGRPPWELAEVALAAGRTADALSILLDEASHGEWLAYCEIGRIYDVGGNDVVPDVQKALYWYRKSVFEADDPNAHFGLGRLYYEGRGVERDYCRAEEHLAKSLVTPAPMELNARYRIMAYVLLFQLWNEHLGENRNVIKARGYLERGIAEGYAWPLFLLASEELRRGKILRWLTLRLRGALIVGRTRDKTDPLITGCQRGALEL